MQFNHFVFLLETYMACSFRTSFRENEEIDVYECRNTDSNLIRGNLKCSSGILNYNQMPFYNIESNFVEIERETLKTIPSFYYSLSIISTKI